MTKLLGQLRVVPGSQVTQLRQVLNGLVIEHGRQLAIVMDNLYAVGAEPEDIRYMFADHVQPFIDLAAEHTAQWYDDLDPALGFSVTTAHQVEDARIDGTARWALYAPGEAPPLQRFLSSAHRMIYDGSRDVVITNAERESAVYFRDAPQSACRFCRKLTVDPDSYESPRARMPAHDDDCECLAVPARPGHEYRHPDYVKGWEREIHTANTGDFRSTIAGMDRNSV